LLATAMLLIVRLRVTQNSVVMRTLFAYRYILLLMAVSAIYCGFVYTECFGLPIAFFNSHWEKQGNLWRKTDNGVYAIGIDPVWVFKDNELIFTNSMKMKIAIVMGIGQMLFGMMLQMMKLVKNKEWMKLGLKWIPQMMYLISFFGYMVVIVIVKWCNANDVSLIQTLINMALSPGKVDENERLYAGQEGVQIFLFVVFVLSIPLMLVVKPIVEIKREPGRVDYLETFVMTLIDVIEFTLSALSHTASYLRLWALSLAHSQLSKVLYEQLLIRTIDTGNPVAIFCGFVAWVAGTITILLGMECFSALLHAIRLMWVEFSSKFYAGTGYRFNPFSFKVELALHDENEQNNG
jgi:V-type H+-transporting ATPase subunit a